MSKDLRYVFYLGKDDFALRLNKKEMEFILKTLPKAEVKDTPEGIIYLDNYELQERVNLYNIILEEYNIIKEIFNERN